MLIFIFEIKGTDANCVSFPEDGQVKLFNSEKQREKVWDFDQIFGTSSAQADVLNSYINLFCWVYRIFLYKVFNEVSDLVVSVIDGYNVCIFG